MSLGLMLDGLKFVVDRFDNSKDVSQLKRVLREMLRREIALNEALCDEARRLQKSQAQSVETILCELRTDVFDSLGAMGLPLADLFADQDRWSVEERFLFKDQPKSQHVAWLANVNSRSELLERAYHRLIFRKICAQKGISKRVDTVKNLRDILIEAKHAVSDKPSAT